MLMRDCLVQLWRKHREVLTYLMVGGWNTLFGLAMYTVMVHFLWPMIHYMAISLICAVLGITNAYICYKFFVFQTKGNVLREYLRCYVVYGFSWVTRLVPLYCLVDLLDMHPAWANMWVTLLGIIISYFGHKFFTFGKGGWFFGKEKQT